MHSDIVVLGGGPGGYSAAFLAADLGMDVTIVNAEPRLGGVCLLRGCIPSKALLHVARVINEVREMGAWGVEYDTPKINLDQMRETKNNVIDTLTQGLSQLSQRRNVKVIHARAKFTNSQELHLDYLGDGEGESESLTMEHCIVATGSSPAAPGALRADTPRVMDSKGALELEDVPERLLVVGGGYIGLEMGSVYAALGSRVTVVELTPGLLPGADRDLVRPLHSHLEKQFEAILLETKVESLVPRGDEVEVRFTTDDGDEWIDQFDRVLVSVGRRPNSADLGLENTMVEVDDRGFLVVDRQRRTADPHIFAIGDVAGEPMLAHKALHEGKVAVEVIHGDPGAFDVQAIPAVVFTDPELAWAGLTETEAKQQDVEVEIARYPWAASGRAQALRRTEGLTKLLVEPHSQRVLGVGIVGAGAGDMISEAVLAIEMGCQVRDLTESIHPHPTLSETILGAGEINLGIATDIYRPKRKAEASAGG